MHADHFVPFEFELADASCTAGKLPGRGDIFDRVLGGIESLATSFVGKDSLRQDK